MTDDLTRTSLGSRGATPLSSPLSPSAGRFVTGTILAGRYRIVSLVGAGGMGEVYKADDLNWISLLRGGFAQNTGGGAFVLVLIAASIGAAAYVAIGRPALTARARLN